MISSWWSIIVFSAWSACLFKSQNVGIHNIITVDDKSTWVNDYNKQVIRQINIAVVNIVLPWIDFKAATISSWWSIIVFSAWSACLFKSKSDLNFNLIPSEIKYFIPGKETFNDIPNLFGSLQKMKIPQVQSDIDLEVD
jgi:hypothetical protein